MSNNVLKSSLVFFATIFGLIVVLIDDKIETKVKIIAIAIAVLILVLFEWRHYRKNGERKNGKGNYEWIWFAKLRSRLGSISKRRPLLLIFPFLTVLLLALAFFRTSVSIDQSFVSSQAYLAFDSAGPSCPKDYSNLDNQPIVNVTAECALEYADYRSNWCCKYELPSEREVVADPALSEIENCNPSAEFVFDKSDKDRSILSIRQGNSIKPVRIDVTDECTSFRLKSSCHWLCSLTD